MAERTCLRCERRSNRPAPPKSRRFGRAAAADDRETRPRLCIILKKGCLMDLIYRLATVAFRGREFPVIEVNNTLFDLNVGYEEFKQATGRRDFFKARHHYTMLDILEEWELFDAVLGETA